MRKLHLVPRLAAFFWLAAVGFIASTLPASDPSGNRDDKPTYASAAAPLFNKYCNSCHNASDAEGGLSLATPTEIAAGGDNGPALLAGNAQASRMVRMMLGTLEPKMPPDDMAGPNKEELDALMAWIDDGARVDAEMSLVPSKLTVPDVPTRVDTDPISDLAWSPDGKFLAVARYREVQILDGASRKLLFKLPEHPGKVNSVCFSADSRYLLAASGITGLRGVAIEWDLEQRQPVREYGGHADIVYAAVFSRDGKLVATAGYDRKITLWDREVKSSQPVAARQLEGHNDAVYDLQFSPTGQVLASASGDQTVKLWNVKTGERLDTLGQPLKEQLVTRFHPSGEFVLGAGRDNRIRSWKFVSQDKPEINPLLISRFAHEAAIVALAFSPDGKLLVSSAEDRTIKVWSGSGVELITSLPRQPDVAYGLEFSPGNKLAVARMDGTIDFYKLAEPAEASSVQATELPATPVVAPNSLADKSPLSLTEAEPNSMPEQTQAIELPATIEGKFDRDAGGDAEQSTDVDLYRIHVAAGETWVLETNAARSKSPADTRIRVLTLDGDPVPRAKLQAVRDSYFTFRGKDADTSDDFRLHNWEEMELNELLYCNGEVVRLFLYPRGPDSGFKVYPGFGKRHGFLDTTPVAHALQEPCYIVKVFPPDARLVPNGLPEFDLFYENDDDPQRKLGSDSKLFFTAPESGEYLIEVTDARGFHGPAYRYQLTVRSPQPGFSVNFGGRKMTLKRGSGREFSLSADRRDNFQGAIEVRFENVPPGIQLPATVTIQENHYQAEGTFFATADAPQPTPEQIAAIQITAVANINGQEVRQDLGKIEELKLEDSPRIQTRIVAADEELSAEKQEQLFAAGNTEPVVLTIRPGSTISAKLVVKRNQHDGDVDFGNAESGRNLPHGVFVDNIGLNGLRIIKGQGDVREIFITAAKWVPEQTRLFHLRANNVDGETTLPVLLKVEK